MTGTPITLTNEDADKLLDRLKHYPIGVTKKPKRIRNHCMALLMLDAGLRVGEVVQLGQIDLYFSSMPTHTLIVQAAYAKNKTERTIPLSLRIQQAVDSMREYYWNQSPNQFSGFAFYQTDPLKPLTTRQVERIIRKAAMKSLGRPVHPHVLRHTFASRLMRTTNARTVQELLGHKHMSTTQIYMHPNEDDKKKAIRSLEPNQ